MDDKIENSHQLTDVPRGLSEINLNVINYDLLQCGESKGACTDTSFPGSFLLMRKVIHTPFDPQEK